jgi:hypothetical protein
MNNERMILWDIKGDKKRTYYKDRKCRLVLIVNGLDLQLATIFSWFGMGCHYWHSLFNKGYG